MATPPPFAYIELEPRLTFQPPIDDDTTTDRNQLLGARTMNPLDKKAYAFGLVAAAVAVVLPYMVQAALTAAQLAGNAA